MKPQILCHSQPPLSTQTNNMVWFWQKRHEEKAGCYLAIRSHLMKNYPLELSWKSQEVTIKIEALRVLAAFLPGATSNRIFSLSLWFSLLGTRINQHYCQQIRKKKTKTMNPWVTADSRERKLGKQSSKHNVQSWLGFHSWKIRHPMVWP